jgi:elongation factor G
MSTEAKNIRNLCLIGHKGNGKTTLAESMLYFTKATDRLGKIEQGNTVLDFVLREMYKLHSFLQLVNF